MTLRIFGYALVVACIAVIVTLRIIGLDLTEGQLFSTYLPWWLTAIGCGIGGALLVIKNPSE